MPLIEITPPPGVIKPGTIYDAKGRWYDTLWVRWFEGVMQSIGGFEAVEVSGAQVNAGERVSGTHAWRNNSGNPLLAWGGPTLIKVLKGGTVFDVTPSSGFTTGAADAVITTGNYGNGDYGDGLYGVGDTAISDLQEAQSYQMDNYGEDLYFVAHSDGRLWYVDTDGSGGDPQEAEIQTASSGSVPTGNVGVVVTPERFVMCLGAASDHRKIQWPDVDDPTDWLPSATNQAGDIFLPGKGAIMAGRRAQAETLVWTDQDLFSVRYIGGNFIYQAVPVGAVGAISRRSMAIVGSVAYWMGPRGFYIYNGYTQAIDSPLADFVFSDINQNQISKVWAEVRAEFGEVTWHYPSGGSTECDKSVTYNFNDGFWFNNTVNRTAGEDRGAFTYPVAFDPDGLLYRHETGDNFGIASAAVGSGETAAAGAATGWTDFSEFSVASGLPTGLTNEDDGDPVYSIGNDATEGNYLNVTVPAFDDVFNVSIDAFDAVIDDVADCDIELLARIYVDTAQDDNRAWGGPGYFLGGSSAATLDGHTGRIFNHTTDIDDLRAGYVQVVDNSGGFVPGQANIDDDSPPLWMWVRMRITNEGATDDWFFKIWDGDLGDEPAAWTTEQTGTTKRSVSLGSKIGFMGHGFLHTNTDFRISFLSFAYTNGGTLGTPLTPTEAEATKVAAVNVKPEATSGPIEIGKGDNVMHVQSIIPDEKTLGDVDLFILSSFYPTAEETENGPYTPANPTDTRITARQIRLKVVEDQANWRIGTLRADVELGGQR